jgi:branched-chain amino acid transport system permease protein
MPGDAVIAIAIFGALALVPVAGLDSYIIGQATLFLIWATVVTQWNLVFGVAGILSIGQMSMFAAGGYAVGLSGLYFHLSPWMTLPIAGVAGLLMSILMGLSTLRLRGPYVVVVTLAFTMVIYQLIVTDVDCFRHLQTVCYSFTGGSRGITRFGDFGFAALLGFEYALDGNYYLALAILLICTIFALLVAHSPYGRAFQAMRDNEVCAACRGINITKYQLIVFAASGFFTGIAGGVYAGATRTFGPQVLELPTLLFLLSMMIVGGRGHVWGPLIGALVLVGADEAFRDAAQWRNTAYAAVLIIIVILVPDGIAGRLSTALASLRQSTRARKTWIAAVRAPALVGAASVRARGADLEVSGLSKYFGALAAVDDLSFDVASGAVLGIGGPNGAGKSTLFDLISGVAKPSAGMVKFGGRDITSLPPERICHLGISRTFQSNAAFDTMTVRQNVLCGSYFASRDVLLPGLRFDRRAQTAADAAMDLVGIREIAQEQVGTLPILQRKLVMLAGATANKPKLLLLDELVGGLNPKEIEQCADVLRGLRGATGAASHLMAS